jgi:hypothetical protein
MLQLIVQRMRPTLLPHGVSIGLFSTASTRKGALSWIALRAGVALPQDTEGEGGRPAAREVPVLRERVAPAAVVAVPIAECVSTPPQPRRVREGHAVTEARPVPQHSTATGIPIDETDERAQRMPRGGGRPPGEGRPVHGHRVGEATGRGGVYGGSGIWRAVESSSPVSPPTPAPRGSSSPPAERV